MLPLNQAALKSLRTIALNQAALKSLRTIDVHFSEKVQALALKRSIPLHPGAGYRSDNAKK